MNVAWREHPVIMPEEREQPNPDDEQRARYRAMSDAELVVAIRRNSLDALREFYARFEPMLMRHGRRAGISNDLTAECTNDVLAEVATRLATPKARVPRLLAPYLIRSFRHRVINAARDRARRERRDHAAAEEDDDTAEEPAVRTACSEYAIRASHGPGWEIPPLPLVLERLSALLGEALTPEEHLLVSWVSAYVPLRFITAWLGIERSAAKMRISRVRARLKAVAMEHALAQDDDDRQELVRFFRRSHLILTEDLERIRRGVRADTSAGRTTADGAGTRFVKRVAEGDTGYE